MRTHLLALLLAIGCALGLAWPEALLAEVASCSLMASSFSDSVVNPPKGEDTDFFVNSGGVPNVMFLLDSSGSMRRLPPDGAANTWGIFERSGNAVAGDGYGCTNGYGNALVFHSPCGSTTIENVPYSGSTDFAQAKDASGNYCPYMVSGNLPPAVNKAGFDPDFYCGTGNDSCGGDPNFFNPVRVYKDSSWTDITTTNTGDASSDAFCTSHGYGAAKVTSCQTCFANQGYFFDGTYVAVIRGGVQVSCGSTARVLDATGKDVVYSCQAHGDGTCLKDATMLPYQGADDGTAHCYLPNVFFSGNFLNFYPPKFLVARKVLKDVLQSVRKVRLGLTIFNGSDGGDLVEALNPPCNMLGSPSQFDANRTAVKNTINNTNKVRFNASTPLAETLLNIGQLYHSKALPWFSATFQSSAFDDAVASSNNKSVCFACQASSAIVITDGLPNRDGNIPGAGFSSTPMTKVVADTPGSYAGMAGYNITGISTTDCPDCLGDAEKKDDNLPPGTCQGNQDSGACDDAFNPIDSYLPKVAWYLHNLDLRDNAEQGSDAFPMTEKQVLTTYTIGLGTAGSGTVILQDTAKAGGGLFNGGTGTSVTDVKSLREAVLATLEDVNTRSTSFGAASLSTLQAAASQGVLVPRFEPSRSAHWNGHLFAFDLFSEFTSGCAVPASGTSGPANGDFDCDGKCTSVYLRDADGDFIMENGAGQFVKNNPRNRAACGFGNRCTTDCAVPSTTLARPFWDAGDKLAPLDANGAKKAAGTFKKWNDRDVYTVVDSNLDLKLTTDDNLLNLKDADGNDGLVDSLVPYLNIQGSTFCPDLVAKLAVAGNPIAATIDAEVSQTPPKYRGCARVMIQYLRGADIFNEMANSCGTWPNTYCTRPYQLGDVFHSSPVEVWAPLPSDGLLCARGLHPQCLHSLFSTSIPNPPASAVAPAQPNANAYDDYAKSSYYKHRNRFALVGANDGMLHAIVTARWRAGQDDPNTPQREDEAPFEGYYEGRDTSKEPLLGTELWGFVSPDLLGKLPLFMGNAHQFFVDATPMVRDVWIDDTHRNRLVTGTPGDNRREGGEFHTIAVVGERRGGTHYFALDVTDASDDLDARPRFLWIYPQPTDPEQLSFAESYADFVPTPPPVGPVRIDTGAPPCSSNRQTFTTASGAQRCFEERWVVMLSGGFDPQYTRGRGVHLVELGTGKEIFDFSQPPGSGSACTAASDPRCHLNYPVAATVGMMMWGTQTNFLSQAAIDGYFDTATFGDTGGQLWVLRFSDPAKLDPITGKATNWFGARIFQLGKNALTPPCGLDYCGSQPFFYITSNLPLKANGLYRVLAGTVIASTSSTPWAAPAARTTSGPAWSRAAP